MYQYQTFGFCGFGILGFGLVLGLVRNLTPILKPYTDPNPNTYPKPKTQNRPKTHLIDARIVSFIVHTGGRRKERNSTYIRHN